MVVWYLILFLYFFLLRMETTALHISCCPMVLNKLWKFLLNMEPMLIFKPWCFSFFFFFFFFFFWFLFLWLFSFLYLLLWVSLLGCFMLIVNGCVCVIIDFVFILFLTTFFLLKSGWTALHLCCFQRFWTNCENSYWTWIQC